MITSQSNHNTGSFSLSTEMGNKDEQFTTKIFIYPIESKRVSVKGGKSKVSITNNYMFVTLIHNKNQSCIFRNS